MPAKIRVGGQWRDVTPSVKVGGSWRTVAKAWAKVGGSWVVWFASAIADTFNRTTSNALGTTSDGNAVWTNLRGTWFANGSAAQSDGTATDYPLAALTLNKQDVSLTAKTTNGVGLAFWVSDAGSWWAAVPVHYTATEDYQYTYTYSYTYSYTYETDCCTADSCCGGTIQSSGTSCTDQGLGSYTETWNFNCTGNAGQIQGPCGLTANCPPFPTSGSQTYTVYYAQTGCVGGTNNNCCTTYRCNTTGYATGYADATATAQRTRYYWIIRLIRSLTGTVTNILDTPVNDNLDNSNSIVGISVITSGEGITAKAYSDSGLTTQVGSTATYTASGATRGASQGVVKAPSAAQGSTLDAFTAQ